MTGSADLAWMSDAACRFADVSLELFYPTGNDARPDPLAVALCGSCPVRLTCLQYGFTDAHGIYGGMTPTQRRDAGVAVRAKPWSRTNLQPCGTTAAYKRHLQKGQPPCDMCKEASRAYFHGRRQDRRRRAAS